MKRYHVISISVLLGLIAGLAIPTVSHAATAVSPSLTVQDNYPITFWLTAIFGGGGAFFGFFGLIAKVHAFVKAPRFWGFVGLIFIALNYLILSVWWYAMAFNGVGDGYFLAATEYSQAYTKLADPTGLYAYWGYSLALSLVYGFWCLLEWMHSNKQDGHSAEA
ncbi:hypothetical protein DAE87_004581 [Salmonella enterica subsp. enterica serovar Braenderup]|nr:hypothetical protein [Salmonella enterica subsp. enterica serovar Braenderup]